ncbi:MAG: sterol desaturase, partial [Sphingomonas bacterium]|uniref:sterol desaturase family protein n=1 Tax=Sphingomonas bacterium TaxID=1895847 RepID=UPI00260A975F
AWSGFTRSPLTGWLTTTTHHDLHHSEGRHNFGLYFTWWDRWMGTEHPKYHARFENIAGRRARSGEAVTA